MTEPSSEPTLIYIAGYGRSGSTLLGRLLTLRPDVLDLGEVITVTRFVNRRNYRCSCGERLAACPVWGPVFSTLGPRKAQFASKQVHSEIVEQIARGSSARYLVDSSKTAGMHGARPFYLSRHLSVPVEMVHLVRDPRAVLWSVFRLQNRKSGPPEKSLAGIALALKVCLSWMYANLAAESFRLVAPGHYTRLVYDEMLREGLPGWLRTLVPEGRLEGIDLEEASQNQHGVGGNPMRKKRQVQIAGDEEWREKLSPWLSVLVTVICLPLMVRYRLLRSLPTQFAGQPEEGR